MICDIIFKKSCVLTSCVLTFWLQWVGQGAIGVGQVLLGIYWHISVQQKTVNMHQNIFISIITKILCPDIKTEIMLVFKIFPNKSGKMSYSANRDQFCDRLMNDLQWSHQIKSVIYWINWFSCVPTIMLDEVWIH